MHLARNPHARARGSDDVIGASVHAKGEPERRRTQPDGTIADASAEETRAEAHLQIARATFEEAGWAAAVQKTQLGRAIDALGLRASTVGAGELGCPPAKRHGLLHELKLQRGPHEKGVERGVVETLTGRLGHIAQVAVEGNACGGLLKCSFQRNSHISRAGCSTHICPAGTCSRSTRWRMPSGPSRWAVGAR